MKLIADIGATNSRWILKGENDIQTYQDKGFNPAFNPTKDFEIILQSLPINNNEIIGVHIYGAGMSANRTQPILNILETVFPKLQIVELKDDLLGACRAMAQSTPALVCILGTGSNSCYYDGSTIEQNIRPMGYILGDEGSAFSIGREVIRNFCRHKFDKELEEKLQNKYSVTKESTTKTLYAHDRINVAIAQYARFASDNINHPVIQDIVDGKLNEFVDILTQYNKPDLPIFFTGSIANVFQENMIKLLEQRDMGKATFIPDIMTGLEKYHS